MRVRKPMTPEQRKKAQEASRRWRLNHPEKCREYRRRHYESMTPDQLEQKRRSHREWKKRKRLASPEFRAAEAAYMRLMRARQSGREIDTLPPLGEALKRALGENALYAAANAAVPTSYPAHVRDDVIGEIVLAVLEGKIDETEIKAKAKSFVTRYWDQRDMWRTLSLDAPMPGMDGVAYMDRLTDPSALEAFAP